MTKLIRLLGHDAVIAHDGPEAIALATDCRPEQVLLDIGLPGWTATRLPPRSSGLSRLVGGIPTHRRTPCNIPGGLSVL
jgi:hypothetical protein